MSEESRATARVGDLLATARERLRRQTETPSLDAQLLMMRTIGQPRPWILSHPEVELNQTQLDTFESFVERYEGGEALPHVLGYWEFFGRQFHLSPEVLVPRPETEHLVEQGLRRLEARADLRRVLEVGTGSGCVVISLAVEFPHRSYTASDLSAGALTMARKNLQEYRLEGVVHLVQADLLWGLRGPFDLILANLPYIPQERLEGLDVGVREPHLALDGGLDGLDPLRRLAKGLRRSLRPGGELLLELDPGQMTPAEKILRAAVSLDLAETHRDLAGRDRVLLVRRNPKGG